MKSTMNRAVAAASSVLTVLCLSSGGSGSAIAQTTQGLNPTQPSGENAQAQAQGGLPEVTVEGHHEVQRQRVGRTSSGIPIEEVSISHHVGFQGVGDPVSPEGRAVLDKRIQSAAEEACQQLKELYPLDPWGAREQQRCINDAVRDAQQQVQTMIASGRIPRPNH